MQAKYLYDLTRSHDDRIGIKSKTILTTYGSTYTGQQQPSMEILSRLQSYQRRSGEHPSLHTTIRLPLKSPSVGIVLIRSRSEWGCLMRVNVYRLAL